MSPAPRTRAQVARGGEPRPLGFLAELASRAMKAAEDAGAIAEPDPEPTDEELAAERWADFAPRTFAAARLEDLDGPVADEVRAWAAATSGNLILQGPVGTGKTHAAFACCRLLMEAGWRPVWMPVPDALDDMRPDGDPRVEPRLMDAEVVFLDDFGGERATDWTAERLYRVVNRRWLDGRPTIVTTNLAGEDLTDQVGERVVSRLIDGATIVGVSGADRRRPA